MNFETCHDADNQDEKLVEKSGVTITTRVVLLCQSGKTSLTCASGECWVFRVPSSQRPR